MLDGKRLPMSEKTAQSIRDNSKDDWNIRKNNETIYFININGVIVQNENKMKIIDIMWITGKDSIGIACTENDKGERKFRIAKIEGEDIDYDTQQVADWGAEFYPEYVNDFINRNIKKQENDKNESTGN